MVRGEVELRGWSGMAAKRAGVMADAYGNVTASFTSSERKESNRVEVSSQAQVHAMEAETPRDARRRSWAVAAADLSARHKVALVVVVSVFSGAVLGDAGGGGWNMGLIIMVLVVLLGALLFGSQWWIAEPVSRLSHRFESLARTRGAEGIKALPTERGDEIGQLARSARALCEMSIRNAHEAGRLRRTLDSLVARETRRATVQLEQMAMHDPLTGLGNRRLLEERLPVLFDECRRDGDDLVCMLVDVDNFKQVNDSLGHAAGDAVLSLMGQMIKGAIRPGDLAVRLGGDEFALFLPAVSVERAEALSGQLRHLLRQEVRRQHPDGPWADLSAGIATLQREGCDDGEELLAMADEHLYSAKRAGKGCTHGGVLVDG